jgi:hypothetical protein
MIQNTLFSVAPKAKVQHPMKPNKLNGMFYNKATDTIISYVLGDKYGEWTLDHEDFTKAYIKQMQKERAI